jgi:hypothetical protein
LGPMALMTASVKLGSKRCCESSWYVGAEAIVKVWRCGDEGRGLWQDSSLYVREANEDY